MFKTKDNKNKRAEDKKKKLKRGCVEFSSIPPTANHHDITKINIKNILKTVIKV